MSNKTSRVAMATGEDKADRAIDLLAAAPDPAGLSEAVGLLDAALAEGSGRAAHQSAVLAAAGVGAPPDWTRAMALLGISAALGFTKAQTQLRLLSGHDGSDWRGMARAVDLAAWMTPPAKARLCDSPRVRAVEAFVAPAVCDWLVGIAAGRLAPAQTYSATGEARLERGRTNTETDFNITESDMVLTLVRARIAVTTGLPSSAMELTKVLHYAPGQQFNRHFDCLDPDVEGHAAEIAARGQRIATFLLYLNDDYDGGETEFPQPGLRHRGAKGDGLFFANVDLAGAPDRASLHQGAAPTRGEKWLLSQWIRNRSQ